MYRRITDENPYQVPMRIYPAVHYTMGGLWVDYDLMSTIPGLFVLGEANFSDHGANRLGASALMQGLADGYFVAPYTVANYLAGAPMPAVAHRARRVQGSRRRRRRTRIDKVLASKASARSREFHRAARRDLLGPRRHGPQRAGPAATRSPRSASSATSSGRTSSVPGEKNNLNPSLDYAGRVADYMEFARAAGARRAGARANRAAATSAKSSRRPTAKPCATTTNIQYVAAWEFKGVGAQPDLHKEELVFEEVHPTQRSYK